MPTSNTVAIPEIAKAAVDVAVAEAEAITLEVMEEEIQRLRGEVEELRSSAAEVVSAAQEARPEAGPTPARPRRAARASASGTRGAVSIREAIPDVLSGGKEMHAKEISAAVIAHDGVVLNGKTPEATIAAFLATENKKGRTGLVRRTKPGVYKLRARAGR